MSSWFEASPERRTGIWKASRNRQHLPHARCARGEGSVRLDLTRKDGGHRAGSWVFQLRSQAGCRHRRAPGRDCFAFSGAGVLWREEPFQKSSPTKGGRRNAVPPFNLPRTACRGPSLRREQGEGVIARVSRPAAPRPVFPCQEWRGAYLLPVGAAAVGPADHGRDRHRRAPLGRREGIGREADRCRLLARYSRSPP